MSSLYGIAFFYLLVRFYINKIPHVQLFSTFLLILLPRRPATTFGELGALPEPLRYALFPGYLPLTGTRASASFKTQMICDSVKRDLYVNLLALKSCQKDQLLGPYDLGKLTDERDSMQSAFDAAE